MLFAVLAVAAQLDRDYIRDKTLEGQQAAAAKGRHGGRPKVFDDDMLTFALALRAKGVPVPEIAGKLVIKTGKNIGGHPSAASVYRALAEAGQDDLGPAQDPVPWPRPARLSDKVDPARRERLQSQPHPDPYVPA